MSNKSLHIIIILAILTAGVGVVCAESPWEHEYTTADLGIFSFEEFDGYMYAGTGTAGKIYYCDLTTPGEWSMAYDTSATTIRGMREWEGYLYAGTDTGGYIYRTNGTSLDTANNTAETTVECFEYFNGYLYAGTGYNGKILRSNDGLIWPDAADLSDDAVYCLKEYKGYLYAGVDEKLYRSADGSTFNYFNNFTEDYVYDLEVFDGYLYITTGGGADDGNIYRTDGTTATLVYSTGLMCVWDMTVADHALYAGADQGYIFRSSTGNIWEQDFSTVQPYIYAMGSSNGRVYAGTAFLSGKVFTLDTVLSDAGYGIQYPPHSVRLVCIDTWGNPITGATITAVPESTSLGSWTWLTDIFGFDADADIAGSTMQGTTGSDGAVSFLMIPEIQYNVSVVKASSGINQFVAVFPKDSEYLIRIGALPYPVDYPEYTLNATDVNSSYVRLQMTFTDSGNVTSGMIFNVYDSDSALVYSTPVSLTAGSGSAYYDVSNTRGDTYLFGFNGTNTVHGNVSSYQGIDLKGSGKLVDFGWPDLYYAIISISVIFLVAGAMGETDVKIGAILIPIFAGLFWYIGWIPAAVGAIINVLFFLGAFYYIRASLKAVDT